MEMNLFESLDQLVAAGNGYLCTAQVMERGISRPTLAEYVRRRGMERMAHGIYLSPDAWPDELYQLSLANSRIVFSHETALLLHGLMEREPNHICLTVSAGYNASHLRKRGIQVHQVKPDLAELGATTVLTSFGNRVRVYDMERTICDMIRSKNNMDIQIFRYAMREYIAHPEKNLNRLMQYSKQLRVEDAVRTYTEVML